MKQQFKINQTVWLSNSLKYDGKLIVARIREIRTIENSSETRTDYALRPVDNSNEVTLSQQFIHGSAKEALIAIGDRNDIDHGIKYKVL